MTLKRKKRFEGTRKLVASRENAEKMERAQIWSIDVLLAVVIFVSIIMIFYVTLGSNDKLSIKELQGEASKLRVELEKNPQLGFIENDAINSTKFDQFAQGTQQNYDSVKEELGVRGDFCIYFEDENGNLVLIQGNRTGVGSSDINVSDTPCGQRKW